MSASAVKTIKGGPELIQFLNAFPDKVRKAALRSAIVAAAGKVRDQARLNAPKKTGAMAKAIKTGSPNIDEAGNVRVRVRMAGKHSFLGHFIEYGVRPHFIVARAAGVTGRSLTKAMNAGDDPKRLRKRGGRTVLRINDDFVSGAVLHPGFPARPFLRPALDQASDEAIRAFSDRLKSYLLSKTGFTVPTLDVDGD